MQAFTMSLELARLKGASAQPIDPSSQGRELRNQSTKGNNESEVVGSRQHRYQTRLQRNLSLALGWPLFGRHPCQMFACPICSSQTDSRSAD